MTVTKAHAPPDPARPEDIRGNEPLACRNLRARHGRIEVCHRIDLDVERSAIVTLLGPNGAGKSSFLGAVAGEVSAVGTIRVAGRRVDKLPAHRRAKAGVALVPEMRANCFVTMSVRENLLLGAKLARSDERAWALEYVLELFPVLKQRLTQQAGTLSGGEQQMLAIGMALAQRPALLMLDEPSQGLAPRVLHSLRATLETLRDVGVGMLVAEQNHAFASEIADRFAIMVGGVLVTSGTGAELDRDAVAAAYLSFEGDPSS